jgi:hypothetical protein
MKLGAAFGFFSAKTQIIRHSGECRNPEAVKLIA